MGINANLDQILNDQILRDELDAKRPFGALRPASDCVIIQSDDLSMEQVIEEMLSIVRSKSQSSQ
jgi:cytidylate kinase